MHPVCQRASCLLCIPTRASCIWATCFVFKGPNCIHGPSLTWSGSSQLPTQAASAQCSGVPFKLSPGIWAVLYLSSALAFASLDLLTWGSLPFVWWCLGCWWDLPFGSSAGPGLGHLVQVWWKGILGGQNVTPASVVSTDCSWLALLIGGTLVLKLCYNFPIEIRITACLQVADEGKDVTRSLYPG